MNVQETTAEKPNQAGVSGRDLLRSLEDLVQSRFPEGLVRRLERRYGYEGTLGEDAVADALASMVKYADSLSVDDPPHYLTAAASNAMRKGLKRRQQLGEEELDELSGEPLFRSEEDGKRIYRRAESIIEGWENKNMRVVTSLVVQSTFLGEVLTMSELRDEAEAILSEEISLDSVKKLKERGLDRLAAAFAELGLGPEGMEDE